MTAYKAFVIHTVRDAGGLVASDVSRRHQPSAAVGPPGANLTFAAVAKQWELILCLNNDAVDSKPALAIR